MLADRGARLRVFAITWIAYASYYLCRKPFSVAKSTLSTELHLGVDDLAWIDTGYLIAYAGGQFASGLLCDRVGPRRLIAFGMLASAGATAAFGLQSTAAAFSLAFAVNGLAQSTGWPGTIKSLTPWWPAAVRGRVMGLWSTCYQLGGLAATALAVWLLAHHGWRSSFFVPAAWVALVGLIALLFLREHPSVHAPSPELRAARASPLRQPVLWILGGAYFSLKLIRYSLLFWLPFYLHKGLGYSPERAGYLSLSFELGGSLGPIVGGWLGDRWGGRRGMVAVAMTLGLAGACALYVRVAPLGALPNFLGMALVGFMLFGPDALISSVAAQELGGEAGAGTAAGLINGLGSIGAIAQGAVTATLSRRYGWNALFWLFVVLALIASAALLPWARRRPGEGAQRAAPSS